VYGAVHHGEPHPVVVQQEGDDWFGHLGGGRERAGKGRELLLVGNVVVGAFLKANICYILIII